MRISASRKAGIGAFICAVALGAFSQETPSPDSASAPQESAAPATSTATDKRKQTPTQQAWDMLRTGANSDKIEERTIVVRVLSLMPGQGKAVVMARKALQDDKPEVRAAAANTLGELHSRADIPKLKAALSDQDASVVLGAAHALVELKEPAGYETFYEILTGERKTSSGLVSEQLSVLKDPKKMAELGFQEGIGFIPFAGMGYTAIKTILKDDNSPVRAAAARILASDRDPASGKALVDQVVNDKSEAVRTAALQAIALRNDPAYIEKLVPAMFDAKDSVKYTAAATILRLSVIPRGAVAAKR